MHGSEISLSISKLVGFLVPWYIIDLHHFSKYMSNFPQLIKIEANKFHGIRLEGPLFRRKEEVDSWFVIKENKFIGCFQGLYSTTFGNNWGNIDINLVSSSEHHFTTLHLRVGGTRLKIREVNLAPVWETLKIHPKCLVLRSHFYSDYVN